MFGILTSGIVNIFGGVPRLDILSIALCIGHTRLDPGNLAPKLEYERGQSPASIGFKEQRVRELGKKFCTYILFEIRSHEFHGREVDRHRHLFQG